MRAAAPRRLAPRGLPWVFRAANAAGIWMKSPQPLFCNLILMRMHDLTHMKNNILSIIRFFLILLVLFICLASAAAGFAAYRLPSLASEKYGPPGPGLNFTQRVLYSFRLLSSDRSLRTPLDPKGVPQSFTVKLGESVNSIATRLEEEHLITNADAFRTYLIY